MGMHGIAVALQTELAKDVSLVHGDQIQLQQVMLNSIINAIEAMSGVSEGSRELRISTGKIGRVAHASRCVIRVRELTRRVWTVSSILSTRPNSAARAWDYRS